MSPMLGYVRQNGLMIVLAGVLAWLVWLQLSTVFEETWKGEIPVRIVLEDDGKILRLSEPRPGRVTVEVRGNRRDLDRLRSTLTATFQIRTEEVDPGQERQTRTFSAGDLRFPKEIELLEMSPARVNVEFAALGKQRVEVRAVYQNVPDELEMLPELVHPKTVEVVGPAASVTAVKSLSTEPIDLDRMADEIKKAGARGEIPKDVAVDARTLPPGAEVRPRGVDVLLRFRWVTRRTVWVPLEVHWVDPDPERNPRCFQINTSSVVESREGRWMIQVTLRGPRGTLVSEQDLAGIRAYMRSDEVDLTAATANVRFERLPPGVVAEPLAGLTDIDPAEFELIRR